MLQIREAQFRSLARALDGPFLDQTLQFLAERHPDVCIGVPAEAMRARIASGVELARQYRFESGAAVAMFVLLLFTEGPAFHTHPSVSAILARTTSEPDGRIETLLTGLSASEWGSVRRHGHAGAWPERPLRA